jgi:hypothetical protein
MTLLNWIEFKTCQIVSGNLNNEIRINCLILGNGFISPYRLDGNHVRARLAVHGVIYAVRAEAVISGQSFLKFVS